MHQSREGKPFRNLEIAVPLPTRVSVHKTYYGKSVVPEIGIQFLPFGDKTYPDLHEHL